MTSIAESPRPNLRRLYWLGPATVVASVAAVVVVQQIAVALLDPPTPNILRSPAPTIFTTALVAAAVVVFAIIGTEAAHPYRTYRRVALVVLFVSFVPDLAIGMGFVRGEGWPLAVAYGVMHIVAWAVTVSMLTKWTAPKTESPTVDAG